MLDADGCDQFPRSAPGDRFAVIHDGHTLAELLRFVHVVRGQDDGAAVFLELRDEVPQLAARLRVEAGGRFVEKQQVGVADQRAGQREALFLAAGEIADSGVAFFLQLNQSNGILWRRTLAEEAAKELNRFQNRKFVGKLCFLELDPQALAEFGGVGLPVQAEDFDHAGVGFGEALADFDGGGLTRAVGAQQAETFAGIHL